MSGRIFRLPDLGEGLQEAEILEWKVKVGDTVAVDQAIVEVETAKAAVEVPCPIGGVVVELHGAPGEVRQVGTPLITVEDTTAGLDGGDDMTHERHRVEEQAGSGNVLIGYGTGHSPRRRRRVTPAVAGGGSGAPSASSPTSLPAPTPTRIASNDTAPRVVSPIVRNLARCNGIEVARLHGSGPGGVITRADIDAAISQRDTVPPRPSGDHREDARIPLRGLRKTVADKLTASRREIPDATTWVDVDATEFFTARRAINAALPADEQVSVFALLARLALAALAQFPELNATVDLGREEIVRFGHVHLGIAAQTPRGLVVPVIEYADRLSTAELARQLAETTTLAREGKLPPARLSGSTFTLNNYGVFGVDGSTPIINYPEAAILGVGRFIDKPWVVDGQLAIRTVGQVSLSFDHRVCDGGSAGGFLRLFADYLEHPIAALGRL
ncbi:2-oxo acid dehydrogenase subunit E2 [Nocardia sp. NEAU-G5]|uniref:Dihydrolipoamide acetyltransferase component of pyruvate dehydrogenase complex n=1 Tax=Nocardia albiluteola TaxID=2842303 RepID=A0ABS6AZ62_9NOCA|nr:dihydrolipoamide acetyltransferase family protein [Nocardia albiluteola]MBU3062290.1 2-oxo acid dehydrogenase subunit E2 [Nocardia albiluteola]